MESSPRDTLRSRITAEQERALALAGQAVSPRAQRSKLSGDDDVAVVYRRSPNKQRKGHGTLSIDAEGVELTSPQQDSADPVLASVDGRGNATGFTFRNTTAVKDPLRSTPPLHDPSRGTPPFDPSRGTLPFDAGSGTPVFDAVKGTPVFDALRSTGDPTGRAHPRGAEEAHGFRQDPDQSEALITHSFIQSGSEAEVLSSADELDAQRGASARASDREGSRSLPSNDQMDSQRYGSNYLSSSQAGSWWHWSFWQPILTLSCSPKLFLQVGSVLQWCMFNIIMILVNNEIFQKFGFTFPLSLTTVHFIISYIGAFVVIEVLRIRPKAVVDSGALVRWVLPMAAVTCFNVVLSQLSVRYIPLPTLLLTKALSPGLTVIIQVVVLGSEFDPWVCASLLPVIGGVVLAHASEVTRQVQGDYVILSSSLGSVVLGCATVICAEVLLQERTFNLDSINALYQMVPYSALILAPPALFFEGKELFHWFTTLLDPLPALLAILVSGFFAFCLNFSLFYTIQNTSALTFNVAGNLKMAVSVLFAGLLFHAPMTQLKAGGCALEFLGVGVYGWALFRIRKQKLEMSRTDSERKRLRDAMKEENVDVYLGAML